jgi:hypothetical protein
MEGKVDHGFCCWILIEGSGVGGGGWRWNGHHGGVGIQSADPTIQGCKVKKKINKIKNKNETNINN